MPDPYVDLDVATREALGWDSAEEYALLREVDESERLRGRFPMDVTLPHPMCRIVAPPMTVIFNPETLDSINALGAAIRRYVEQAVMETTE